MLKSVCRAKRGPMERRKRSTTAGELEWTPAPEPPSPASPGGSELSCWGGDGGEEDNFQSQMDERGIIGLEEAHGEEPTLGLGDELGPDEDDLGSSPYFERVRALLHIFCFRTVIMHSNLHKEIFQVYGDGLSCASASFTMPLCAKSVDAVTRHTFQHMFTLCCVGTLCEL